MIPRLERFLYDSDMGLHLVVEKHLTGQHDQSSHGSWSDGKEIQLNSNDNEYAWNVILTQESKDLDSPKKSHPERYDTRGNLIDGQIENRMAPTKDGQSAPEVLEIMGIPLREWHKVPDGERTSSPIGKIVARKPLKHLYRVVSENEFNQAKERGFFQSDTRMNVADDEGTVASHRSTGEFYVPPNGDSYRIVRFRYDPIDNWRLDFDGYEKTNALVPFDRVDAFTSILANPRLVSKHLAGQHDQSSHGSWAEGHDTSQFANAGDRQHELIHASQIGPSEERLNKIVQGLEEATVEDFEPVFNMEHTGVCADGLTRTFQMKVTGVRQYDSSFETFVDGEILDESTGGTVGEFSRRFYYEGKELRVENRIFAFSSRTNTKLGKSGLGSAFIRKTENYFMTHGVKAVTLKTAWDGAYTWAKMGYDWNPSDKSFYNDLADSIAKDYVHNRNSLNDNAVQQIKSIVDRLRGGRANRPTPYEVSMMGFNNGDTQWFGKNFMYEKRFYYIKHLDKPEFAKRSVFVTVPIALSEHYFGGQNH